MSNQIENVNDAKFARVINHKTILCDFRKSRRKAPSTVAGMVRGIANRHFWGSTDGMVRDVDSRTGDSGVLLGSNLVEVYQVRSVDSGIWIATLDHLTPEQTRPIAQKYLEENK